MALVAKAIVESIRPPLPELVGVRRQPVSAPEPRTRHGVAKQLSHLLDPCLELLAAGDRAALWRCAGTPLALERPRGEILVGFSTFDRLDATLDAHLAVERAPVEQQARAVVRPQLRSLAALLYGANRSRRHDPPWRS